MKSVIIITGASGAGKNYYAEKNFKNYDDLDRIDHHGITDEGMISFLRTIRSTYLVVTEKHVPTIVRLQQQAGIDVRQIILIVPSYELWKRAIELKIQSVERAGKQWSGKESTLKWWRTCLGYTEKQFHSYMAAIQTELAALKIPLKVVSNVPRDVDAITKGHHEEGGSQ